MKFRLGKHDPGVRHYIEAKKEMIPKAMRMFGLEFYRQVIISTPVDTGRARYGWNCAIGMPDFSVPAEAPADWVGQSSGGGAYYSVDAERADKKFAVKDLDIGVTIFITNAVPYISSLNDGHSRQAPARFVELAFLNAVEKLKIWINNGGRS